MSDGINQAEMIELKEDVSASPYYSDDLAPIKPQNRTWGTWDYAALWIAMSACTLSFSLPMGLILRGMTWYQSVITVVLGNLIVLVPLILNANVGTKFGISFPVYCRASFGIRGASIAVIMRSLIACAWFGLQCWIGGRGLYIPLTIIFPSLQDAPAVINAITLPELLCFFAFWALSLGLIYSGIETIRRFMKIAAPILIVAPIALLIWAISAAGGLEKTLAAEKTFYRGEGGTDFWKLFIPCLTGVIGFWSTLAINIPDFSRFAKSQRAQSVGQSVGLPLTMGLYGLIGILVTSAALVLYAKSLPDPIDLLDVAFNRPIQAVDATKAADDAKDEADDAATEPNSATAVSDTQPVVRTAVKRDSPTGTAILIAILSAITLTIATLTTNVAANLVGAANGFASLMPKTIGFKSGALITGILGILMQPWQLDGSDNYFVNWLNAYSILLGALGGILIVDYYLVRNRVIQVAELYKVGGRYWYRNGFNITAMIAFIAGIALCAPGYLQQIGYMDFGPDSFWSKIYFYGWFVSFIISGIVYKLLSKGPA